MYLTIENQTSAYELSGLSVSAWVKPDYSQGSAEFTVLSKEYSLILSVNNNIKPEKIAKFSIFDGIKWTDTEGSTIIDEHWTSLAATFNGTFITLYVNGNLESAAELSDISSLLVNGTLPTLDSISSEKDLVVGSYMNTKNGLETSTNQFSGEIDGVLLFNSTINQEIITDLYESNIEHYSSLEVVLSLDEILAQIIAEQSNSTSIDLTNSTSIDLTNSTSIDLTNSTSIDLTNSTSIDLTNSTSIDLTNSTSKLITRKLCAI